MTIMKLSVDLSDRRPRSS